MATTITRTGGDTVIARTGLTDITITSTTDVEITYNEDELWINILVLGADDAPIALEVSDITTVNGVNVTAYTIEQLVTYIADNCFGIISEIDGNLTVNGSISSVGPSGLLYNFQSGNTALKTYSKVEGVTVVCYQSEAGNPFTKTTDIVANADSGVASVLRLLTAPSGGNPTTALLIKSNGVINMPLVPTSSAGLVTGDIWNDGGTLKIV